MWRVVGLATALCLLPGCKDEEAPVDIPFEGLDPGAGDAKPRPKPPPEPEASATATAGPKAPPGLSGVQACCSALYARYQKATDEGTKAVNKQAASVCSGVARKVAQGKMTRAQALAQVRSSLLGSAPSACR